MSEQKFEQKPGTGVLFQKEKRNERAPSYTGFFVLPDGRIIGIALWPKKTQSGKTLLSLAIDDQEGAYHAKKHNRPHMRADESRAQGPSRARQRDEGGFSPDLDDDIPF